MSDLAPFVAATLRDRVVLELEEALQRERQTNADLKSLEVIVDGAGAVFAYHSKGSIPNGECVERHSAFGVPVRCWKVDLPNPAQQELLVLDDYDDDDTESNNNSSTNTDSLFLPPTLEAIQTLRIVMGGGWWQKTLFNEFADPHVVPKQYDEATKTAQFKVDVAYAGDRVKSLVLCVKPVTSMEQFHQVVGAPPGGLFSRLVQWVQQQQQQTQQTHMWVDSVFLDVGEMQTIFNTMNIQPTLRRQEVEDDPIGLLQRFGGADFVLQQGIQDAIQNAFMAGIQRQTQAAQLQTQAAQRQAHAALRQMGLNINDDDDDAP